MKEDKAKGWLIQMISGLRYMHIHNIAHRDLKLENILLFEDNTVKLADFGFVCKVIS